MTYDHVHQRFNSIGDARDLLRLSDPFTMKDLRASYIRECMVLHPDRSTLDKVTLVLPSLLCVHVFFLGRWFQIAWYGRYNHCHPPMCRKQRRAYFWR